MFLVRPSQRRHSIGSSIELFKDLEYTSNLRRSTSYDSFEEQLKSEEEEASSTLNFRDWLKKNQRTIKK